MLNRLKLIKGKIDIDFTEIEVIENTHTFLVHPMCCSSLLRGLVIFDSAKEINIKIKQKYTKSNHEKVQEYLKPSNTHWMNERIVIK